MSNIDLTPNEARVVRDTLVRLGRMHLAGDASTGDVAEANGGEAAGAVERMIGTQAARRCRVYHIPDDFLLSVVIPVFNEAATVDKVIQRVRAIELPCEIIVVDDGSTDGTREVLQCLATADDLRVFMHEHNQGKGAALKTGFAAARGDVVVIQDADMEYDPRDFIDLLQPIVEDEVDIVYGSRFSRSSRSQSPRWHQQGNRLITRLSNLRTRQSFTDVETCYKMIRRELLEKISGSLREKGFGIELEITAKLAKLKGVRFCERPISYEKRSYAEGKKIGWRDAVWAMWCILRY